MALPSLTTPIRHNELYIEMNDELNVPGQFKGIKCIF